MQWRQQGRLYYECLVRNPYYTLWWEFDRPDPVASIFTMIAPVGAEHPLSEEVQWQLWQLHVLKAVQPLLAAFKELGIIPTAAAAEGAAAQPTTCACTESGMLVSGCSATGQSSSAGSSQAGTFTAHMAAAAAAAPNRSSGATCCSCSSGVHNGQQQRQHLKPNGPSSQLCQAQQSS
jgi:hypothetical protein